MTSSSAKTDTLNSMSHAKYNVQQKSKFDKSEDRTLILTSYCFHVQFVQGTPPKTIIKTECTIPFVDIAILETDKPDEIAFLLHDQTRLVYGTTAANVLSIIIHIMSSMMLHFPEIKIEEKMIQVKAPDSERRNNISESLEQRRQRVVLSPCGSFRGMYEYFCKYFNTPTRDEVIWDVETVYHSQNKKILFLKDFDHIDGKDLLPIIGAVAFSNWFIGLDASGVRLNVDAQTQVLQVLKKNRQLEVLNLENSSIKSDFCSKMPGCIESTGGSVTELNLGNNPIGDNGVVALCGLFMKLRTHLQKLSLSGCGITARGANRLAESFVGSIHSLQAALTHLDLSANSLRGEELSQFCNFLANPNSLQTLDLTKSDCPIDTISVSLSRGCTQHLRVLRLSSNPFFPTKKVSSVSDSWRLFFASTIALEEVHLSSCRLPLEAVKLLFKGLSSNHSISTFFLNLSSNDLRAIGATELLVKHLSDLPMLSALDISDNDLNHEMTRIIDALSSNSHIKHLKIGANYNAMKSRQRIEIMEKLARLVQSSTTIESLSLADSRLKGDITILLNDLIGNKSLSQLDISGNSIGDVGLRILARVLVLNTHLRDLTWDKNNLSIQSLEEMAKSLEHNHTIQYLRTPGIDLIPLMQRYPERTTTLLAKIEETLAKNHGLRKISSDRAFKLQQGLMSSATHQLIDKLIVQLDGRCSRLEQADESLLTDESKEAITESRAAIRDAQASKQLLATMQSEVLAREDDRNKLIATSLADATAQLRAKMEEQSKSDLQKMLDLAKNKCKFVEKDEKFCEELETKCADETTVSPKFLDKLVAHTLTSGMYNRITEMNLTVASIISDQVLDETVKHLDDCHRLVNRHLASFVTMRRRQKQTESVSSMADEQEATAAPTEAQDEVPDLTPLKRDGSSVKVRPGRPRSTFAVLECSDSEEEKPVVKTTRRSAPLPPGPAPQKPDPRSKSLVVHSTNPPVTDTPVEEVKPARSPKVSESEATDNQLEVSKHPKESESEAVGSPKASESDSLERRSHKGSESDVIEEAPLRISTASESCSAPLDDDVKVDLKEEKELNGKMGDGTSSLASPMTSHSERSASRSMDSLDSLDALGPLPETSASPTLLSHPAKTRPKRPRQHRPTRTTIRQSEVPDDIFAPTPGSANQSFNEEEVEKPTPSPKKTNPPVTPEKGRSSTGSGILKIFKRPGSHKPKSSVSDSPKEEPKVAKEEVKEETKEEPEETHEESPPPKITPRAPRGAPMMLGLDLSELKKKREDLRSGAAAPSGNSGNGTDKTPPQPPPPTGEAPPRPSFALPTLRPVPLRERDPKTPAQKEEEKEKRLSVRDRTAMFNLGTGAAGPAPPPKPSKKPSRPGDRPPVPSEKPQGLRLNPNVQSSTSDA